MPDAKRLHGDDAPMIWLIDATAGRLPLRRRGDDLRPHVGIPTIFDATLGNLPIASIEAVEVLAPYTPPSSRLGLVLVGGAIAFALGADTQFTVGIMAAVTTATFALVAIMISQSSPQRQRLARIRDHSGASRCITYWNQDEQAVKSLFHSAIWTDTTTELERTALDEDERAKLEQMRIGFVLMASALAIVILYYATNMVAVDEPTADFPYQVIHITTWIVVVGVNLVAWFRMAAAKITRRRANRESERRP